VAGEVPDSSRAIPDSSLFGRLAVDAAVGTGEPSDWSAAVRQGVRSIATRGGIERFTMHDSSGSSAGDAGGAAARRVLVVEGDAAATEELAAELRRLGYGVVAVLDADAAIAATVKSLATQAATDPLTGLANRRTLDEVLHREWSRCGREGLPLAVVVMDIDHFKPLNDTAGHQAGDACLAAVAGAVRRVCGRFDAVACRWGGDEFLAILPGTDLPSAVIVADELLTAVRGLRLGHPVAGIGGLVTVSIGVAATTPATAGTAAALVAAADRGLYAAKHSGRDRRVAGTPS
jgi:diguanylate cyclase (GGDEF)-like protein